MTFIAGLLDIILMKAEDFLKITFEMTLTR